ncbi:MAG: hypothetical protein WKG00_23145 [Polyangiaceae bacterium]
MLARLRRGRRLSGLDELRRGRLQLTSPILDPSSGPVVLGDTVLISEFSQHMSIMDSIQHGREYANARREGSDDIGNVEVQYPDVDWTNYQDFWGDITVAGPAAYGYGGNPDADHGWSDGVILHEYGHHLEYDISDVDTSGGGHTSCQDKGYGFAWCEGWATYFASTVQATLPLAVNGDFSNIEPNPGCASPGAEAVTRSVLWDLFDAAGGEPHDRMDGATVGYNGEFVRDTLFGVFDIEQGAMILAGNVILDPTTTAHGFHDALVNRSLYYGAHADMDRIYAAHGVLPHGLSDFSVPSIVPTPSTVVSGKNVSLKITLSNSGGVAYTDEHLLVTITTWPRAAPRSSSIRSW